MHFDSIKGEKPETVEVRGQIAELKTLRLDGRAFGAKMVERNPAETSPAGTSYLSPAL